MATNRFVVEVLCSGLGYAKTKYGAATLQEAQTAEDELRADNTAWVNPLAPKQTRVCDTLYGTTHTRVLADCC